MTARSSNDTMPTLGPHLETTRLHFDRIIVATDFSASSQKALHVAMNMARQFNSMLTVVHAIPPIVSSPEFPVSETVLNAKLEDVKEQLRNISKQLSRWKIIHDEVFSSAPAVECIVETGERLKANLIVMGSHGAHGLEKVAWGSVAEAVLRHSHTPVMIVGPNCSTESLPAEYKSVLLASDLRMDSLRAAQYATAIAEESNAKLVLVYVEPNPAAIKLSLPEMNERIKNLVPVDADLWCKPSVRLEGGEISEHILSAALEEKADLIVVATRAGGPLSDHAPWSTLSKTIREATCPVLTVQAHSA